MMNGNASLHSFKLILPRYHADQAKLIDWMISKHLESMTFSKIEEREHLAQVLRRYIVSDKQISTRYFDAPRENVYELSAIKHSGADISDRHRFFGERALEVLKDLYAEERIPDHLIHVTCTGYLSPSAPQLYFAEKENGPDITHAYHMGCYASLPAVRMGNAFALTENNHIDIVHNEICSLHMDPSQHSPEQMVVQSLFADGHIKYSVEQNVKGRRLEIIKVIEKIIPHSENDMTWVPSPVSMQMTLSKEVPIKIKSALSEFLVELARESGLNPQEMILNSIFALHPGGPKIIEAIEQKLELRPDQTELSKKVLHERGNMSSATLPHVWNEILKSNYEGRVVSLAFGPGLTIFGALFEAKA